MALEGVQRSNASLFSRAPPVWLWPVQLFKEPHISGAKSPPGGRGARRDHRGEAASCHQEEIGTVRAKIRAAVEAKVSGRITRMSVDLGQPVREGDLIAEIDAQEIKARMDQALATREQAGQDLKRYTVPA